VAVFAALDGVGEGEAFTDWEMGLSGFDWLHPATRATAARARRIPMVD
jgi:hypothetical protein